MNIPGKNESEPAGMFYDDNLPDREPITNNLLSNEQHIKPENCVCEVILYE